MLIILLCLNHNYSKLSNENYILKNKLNTKLLCSLRLMLLILRMDPVTLFGSDSTYFIENIKLRKYITYFSQCRRRHLTINFKTTKFFFSDFVFLRILSQFTKMFPVWILCPRLTRDINSTKTSLNIFSVPKYSQTGGKTKTSKIISVVITSKFFATFL